MDSLMKAGSEIASNVMKGIKGSKNTRIAGLAALATGAGWVAERAKGHQKALDVEYNREQQMRQQLMSDG